MLLLVHDLDVRVITEEGELLRHLTIDATKDYQPHGRTWDFSRMSRDSRPGAPARLATQQGRRERDSNPRGSSPRGFQAADFRLGQYRLVLLHSL